jgi:hypothetical protein
VLRALVPFIAAGTWSCGKVFAQNGYFGIVLNDFSMSKHINIWFTYVYISMDKNMVDHI